MLIVWWSNSTIRYSTHSSAGGTHHHWGRVFFAVVVWWWSTYGHRSKSIPAKTIDRSALGNISLKLTDWDVLGEPLIPRHATLENTNKILENPLENRMKNPSKQKQKLHIGGSYPTKGPKWLKHLPSEGVNWGGSGGFGTPSGGTGGPLGYRKP